MARPAKFFALLVILHLAAFGALPQTGTPFQNSDGSSPVAYVYVSASNSGGIYAFSAASNGALSAVAGSPFQSDVQGMAVNGKYLFGTDGTYIYSYSVASDGALAPVASINAQQFNGYTCGGPWTLFLDHTGRTLYDLDLYGNSCANNTYQFFDVEKATGKLGYLGVSDPSTVFSTPLSFIGNNLFAYGSSCYHLGAETYGFQRQSDGKLKSLGLHQLMPKAKSGDFYCPYQAAADPTNNLAISVQLYNSETWQPDGPAQLATYTADGSGVLTTKSTYRNMPDTAIQYVEDLSMSPSGKLLAVGGMAMGGTAGLQVFHFNGNKPITHYTGLLTKDEIDQFFWDNNNHLYAISAKSGKLFVFTITPTSVSQAPGSPYTITNAQNIIVLPKP